MDMVKLFTHSVTPPGDNVRAVVESSGFEVVVDCQAVGYNFGPRLNVVPDEQLDGVPIDRLDAAKTNPSKPLLRIPFYRNKNQGLSLRPAPACAFLFPSHIGFIHFHDSL